MWTSDFIAIDKNTIYSCRNFDGIDFGSNKIHITFHLYSSKDLNSAVDVNNSAPVDLSSVDIYTGNDEANYIRISIPEDKLNTAVFMKQDAFSQNVSSYTYTYNENLVTKSNLDSSTSSLLPADDTITATKTAVEGLIQAKLSTYATKTDLDDYTTETKLENTLKDYLKKENIPTELSDYVTKTDLTRLLVETIPENATKVATASEFTTALADTQVNDIELTDNITLDGNTLTISRDVNIYGNGHSINCNRTSESTSNGGLQIIDCYVKLYNLTVYKGGASVVRVGNNTSDPAALYGGRLVAKNCNFYDARDIIEVLGYGSAILINC